MKHIVTRYKKTISRPGLKKGRFRAVFITDLHCASWNDDPDCLPGIIADEKPDLILCGGDIITARPGYSVEPALYFMRKMLKISDVYFGIGNHEYRSRIYPEVYGTMYQDFINPLSKEGVIFLDNKKARIQTCGIPVGIYGLELSREKYKRFKTASLNQEEINSRIGRPRKAEVSILLAHNPKYYQTYLKWGADLTLCGHYHGGIARIGKHSGLISPGLMPFPHNSYGRFDRNKHTLIVSAGLGEHTIPVRINNPRELVVIDFYVKPGTNQSRTG